MSKSIPNSERFTRIQITEELRFTIPESATLFSRGGGYFGQGLILGNNNSNSAGALRFRDGKLQIRNSEEWTTAIQVDSDDVVEGAILIFADDQGTIESSAITIEDNDIFDIDTIEARFLVPPENQQLTLDEVKWPSGQGTTGAILRVISPGVLDFDDNAPVTFTAPSTTSVLPFFNDTLGNLTNSGITVSGGSSNVLTGISSLTSTTLNATTTNTTSLSVNSGAMTLSGTTFSATSLDISTTTGDLSIEANAGDDLFLTTTSAGEINITSGADLTCIAGNLSGGGGSIFHTAGNGLSSGDDGGDIILTAGNGLGANGTGGDVDLVAGNGTDTNSEGGRVLLRSGDGGSGAAERSGHIALVIGANAGSAQTGEVVAATASTSGGIHMIADQSVNVSSDNGLTLAGDATASIADNSSDFAGRLLNVSPATTVTLTFARPYSSPSGPTADGPWVVVTSLNTDNVAIPVHLTAITATGFSVRNDYTADVDICYVVIGGVPHPTFSV